MAETILLGIHLSVYLLLVLTANQVERFSSADKAHGLMGAHNLDEELGMSNLSLDCLLWYLLGTSHRIVRTVFLFASPWLLETQPLLWCALLNCAKAGTFCSAMLGEAHLFAKWGAIFRPKICDLGGSFLGPLFHWT
jgi:superfamily II DNA helicase RecQ